MPVDAEGAEGGTEQQLAASAEFYQSLFEHNPDAVYALDLSGRFTDVNPGATRMTGYARRELVGLPLSHLIAPVSLPAVVAEFERVLAGTPQRLEATIVHKRGHHIVARCVKLPIVVDGRVVGVFGQAVDITDQRRSAAESRLLAHAGALLNGVRDEPAVLDALVRLVVPHLADACVVDLLTPARALVRGPTAHADQQSAAVLAALVGVVPPPHAGSVLERVLRGAEARLLADVGPLFPGELADAPATRDALARLDIRSAIVVPLVSGRRTLGAVWLLSDATSARRFERHDLAFARTLMDRVAAALENARLIAVAHRELAERKRTEEVLRRSEERFRALVEHGSDLISVLDDDIRPVYTSPSHARVLGYTHADLANMNLWDLVHPDDVATAAEHVRELTKRRTTETRYPIRLRARDGSWRSFEATLTDLRDDPAVGGIVANSRDVTDRQRLELRLQHAGKMEAIGRLAGGIAHDFNNLLTAVAGNASLALRALPADSPAREDLEEIARAADRATALTRQLLAFGRKQVLRPTVLSVNDVVDGMDRLLGRLLGARVALRTTLAAGLPPVRADRGQLEQVLMNLAVNARDAMPDGGTLTVETSHAPPHVRVVVRDTGVGMSEEVRARAFDPFFTTKENGHGTGLGLATVYGIVTQSGGQVTLESAPGCGTAATILLPALLDAAVAAADDPAAPGVPRAPHETAAAGGTALVVDDQESVRRVLERILRAVGYHVLSAADGREALAVAAAPGTGASLSLVLTDADMPHLDGYELARELRRRGVTAPVLIVSGHPPPNAAATGGSGVRFLAKPFTIDQLLEAVHAATAAANEA